MFVCVVIWKVLYLGDMRGCEQSRMYGIRLGAETGWRALGREHTKEDDALLRPGRLGFESMELLQNKGEFGRDFDMMVFG